MTTYTKTFTHPNPQIKETYKATIEFQQFKTLVNGKHLSAGQDARKVVQALVAGWVDDKQRQHEASKIQQTLESHLLSKGWEVL